MASILNVDKIRANGSTTDALTIGSGGAISPKIVSFQVRAVNVDQAYTTGSSTPVEYNNVDLDTESGWDATNHRYVASVAGWYMLSAGCRVNTSAASSYFALSIVKNSNSNPSQTDAIRFQYQMSSSTVSHSMIGTPTGMIHLDANDYVNVLFGSQKNATLNEATNIAAMFCGVLVKAD